MTREKTRIILAVGASFAVLIGGVFGVKQLLGPDAKKSTDPAAISQTNENAAGGDQIPAPPAADPPAPPLSNPIRSDDPPAPPGTLIPPPGSIGTVELKPTIKINPKPAKPMLDDPAADDTLNPAPPPPIKRVAHQDKDAAPPPGASPIVLPAPTSGPMTPAPLELPKPMAGDPPPLSAPVTPMNPKPDMPPGDSKPPMPSGPELAPLPADKPKERATLNPDDPPPKIEIPKPSNIELPKPDDAPPKPLDLPKPMADLPKP